MTIRQRILDILLLKIIEAFSGNSFDASSSTYKNYILKPVKDILQEDFRFSGLVRGEGIQFMIKKVKEMSYYKFEQSTTSLDFIQRKQCLLNYLENFSKENPEQYCVVDAQLANIPTHDADAFVNWYSQSKDTSPVKDLFPLDTAKAHILTHSPSEVKNDARIKAFLKFDDFNPRPEEVIPAPPEDKIDFITYVRQNTEKCSFSPEHFQDCKKAWCASSLDKCAGVEMHFEDFNFD